MKRTCEGSLDTSTAMTGNTIPAAEKHPALYIDSFQVHFARITLSADCYAQSQQEMNSGFKQPK